MSYRPGPWQYDKKTGKIVDSTGDDINHLVDDATYEANMRLKAAAPAMLEALKMARENLNFYNGQYIGGPHIGNIRNAMNHAIALAEEKE